MGPIVSYCSSVVFTPSAMCGAGPATPNVATSQNSSALTGPVVVGVNEMFFRIW